MRGWPWLRAQARMRNSLQRVRAVSMGSPSLGSGEGVQGPWQLPRTWSSPRGEVDGFLVQWPSVSHSSLWVTEQGCARSAGRSEGVRGALVHGGTGWGAEARPAGSCCPAQTLAWSPGGSAGPPTPAVVVPPGTGSPLLWKPLWGPAHPWPTFTRVYHVLWLCPPRRGPGAHLLLPRWQQWTLLVWRQLEILWLLQLLAEGAQCACWIPPGVGGPVRVCAALGPHLAQRAHGGQLAADQRCLERVLIGSGRCWEACSLEDTWEEARAAAWSATQPAETLGSCTETSPALLCAQRGSRGVRSHNFPAE